VLFGFATIFATFFLFLLDKYCRNSSLYPPARDKLFSYMCYDLWRTPSICRRTLTSVGSLLFGLALAQTFNLFDNDLGGIGKTGGANKYYNDAAFVSQCPLPVASSNSPPSTSNTTNNLNISTTINAYDSASFSFVKNYAPNKLCAYNFWYPESPYDSTRLNFFGGWAGTPADTSSPFTDEQRFGITITAIMWFFVVMIYGFVIIPMSLVPAYELRFGGSTTRLSIDEEPTLPTRLPEIPKLEIRGDFREMTARTGTTPSTHEDVTLGGHHFTTDRELACRLEEKSQKSAEIRRPVIHDDPALIAENSLRNHNNNNQRRRDDDDRSSVVYVPAQLPFGSML
jgi:hypothetical protein